MSANNLLLWMSAKAAGSWAQFRAAVEELRVGSESEDHSDEDGRYVGLAVYQLQRLNLQRLGHAEFFAPSMATDWRVAPPTLAVTAQDAGVRGVLAGARSLALLRQLHADGVTVEIVTSVDFPDVIRFVAENESALHMLAERTGVNVQLDAACAILSSLPSVAEPSVRRSTVLPFGAAWRIERFSTKDLRWRTATREEALSASAALFRFSLRHQRQILYCASGRAFQIPAQVGKFLALWRGRRRHIIVHDRERNRLTIPAICRPPFLIERALIACSGMPPAYEGGTIGLLHYHDVPVPVAQLTTELLKQDLQ